MTKPLLDFLPFISQLRRNHGLEHAVMHVLTERFQGLIMAGISGPRGFLLMADLPTETVADASLEALKQLQLGETDLAIHEHCGTNLASSTVLAALTAWVVMAGTGSDSRLKLRRLPLAILLAVLVFIFSKPLGPWLQRVLTTSAIPETMVLSQVTTQRVMGRNLHSITTRF